MGIFLSANKVCVKAIPCHRYFFVLAAELLQVLVNRAATMNMLKAPIPQPDDFPIVQYADDTLLIMQDDAR